MRGKPLSVRALVTVVLLLMALLLGVTAAGVWWLLQDRPPRTTLEADLRDARELVRARPDDPEARARMGAVFTRMGRFDDAREEYETALKLDPESPKLRLDAAIAHRLMGDEEAALREARKCIELYPKAEAAHYLVGEIRFEQGRYEDAREALETAVGIEESDGDARLLLGRTYLRLGEDEKALGQFEAVKRMMPDHPEVDGLIEQAKKGEA